MDSLQKNPNEYIRPTEVESEFGGGLSEKRLRHLRYIGAGPAYTKAGTKLVFYRRADVAEWLIRNRVDPSAPVDSASEGTR